jgi:hypothetical protein
MRFGEFVSRVENHTAQSDVVLGEAVQGIAQFSEIHERLQTFMTNIDQKEQEVKNGLDNWLSTKMGIEGFGENIPQAGGPLSSLFHLGMVGRRGSERRGEGSLVDGESVPDDAENPLHTYIETLLGTYFAQAMTPGEDGETANPLQPFIVQAKEELSKASDELLNGNEETGKVGLLQVLHRAVYGNGDNGGGYLFMLRQFVGSDDPPTGALGQLAGARDAAIAELREMLSPISLQRAFRYGINRIDPLRDDPSQRGDEMR